MLIAFNIGAAISEGLFGLSLIIDGIVYWFISLLFELYQSLAAFEILTNDSYQIIVDRLLVVLGVVMLFYLAYALLKALVNPDELNKTTGKIVTNVVMALILLLVVPVIFKYAYKFQNIVIGENIIGQIVLGEGIDSQYNTIASVGKNTAMSFFDAFIEVNPGAAPEIDDNGIKYENWDSLKTCIVNNSITGCQGNESFHHVSLLAPAVTAGDIKYTFILSTLCGIFLAYVIFSFCLDLGVRVVKLAFYQIISPIPILMKIVPEKKSVFDNWIKVTLATYLEVFIRLFIMYLVAFIATLIPNLMSSFNDGQGDLNIFGTVIVLMGVFAFAKEAPKLIGDVIGIKSGNMKLGITSKLANGGGLMLGAAVGGSATAGMKNLTHGFGNAVKNFKDGNIKAGVGSLLKTPFSVKAGLKSGFIRGAYNARNAKTFGDVKKYAGQGAAEAVKARDKREAYKAQHGGTFRGTALGHITDIGVEIGNWMGLTSPLEQLKIEQSAAQEVKNTEKAIDDRLSAIVERDQNTRKLSTGPVTVASIGMSFDTLADLRNQIEIMKSTGTYTDSGGTVHQVSGQILTEMAQQEFKMKKALKKEVLKGYKKDGTRMSRNEFASEYDSQLKELVTSHRTKALQNINVLSANAEKDNLTQQSLENIRKQAVDNKNEDLREFILTDHTFNQVDATGATISVTRSNIESLFEAGKDSINSANTTLNVKVAKKIEEEKKKKSS